MLLFTRVLIIVMIFGMVGTVFLASSQGWWHYTFRNPNVLNQYQRENEQYRQYYQSNSSFSRNSGFRTSSNRSFRSGSRGSRGK